MISLFYYKHAFSIKWIGVAFMIKLALFLFFSYNFYKNKSDFNSHFIFNASGDTWGYYDPCENFVITGNYNSYCRMPGLLPIYSFLRLIFDVAWTKTLIIILQFLTGVLSVYILAKTAKLLFKSDRIFVYTFFTYAISSFVSIWDHVGYADSFGASFLIFSIYLLLRYKQNKKTSYLLISSLFMIWSVFFRPIHGIFIPIVVIFYLFNFRFFAQSLNRNLIYTIPVIICLGLWSFKNYKATQNLIVLQGPIAKCFPGITEQMLTIRGLIVSWGDDVQPWAKGTAGEWFFSSKTSLEHADPNKGDIYTKEYTIDSLIKLRTSYRYSISDTIPETLKKSYKLYVITKSELYTSSYKQENKIKAYVFNKFILLKRLVLPNRLDDLPFPALSQMTLLQKGLKGFYFLLLLVVNFFGLIGAIVCLFKKNPIGLFPLAILSILTLVFGVPEQRYLVPVYPYFLMLSIFLLTECYGYLKRRKIQ